GATGVGYGPARVTRTVVAAGMRAAALAGATSTRYRVSGTSPSNATRGSSTIASRASPAPSSRTSYHSAPATGFHATSSVSTPATLCQPGSVMGDGALGSPDGVADRHPPEPSCVDASTSAGTSVIANPSRCSQATEK